MKNVHIAPALLPADTVINTHHGVEVSDPFRWLEEPLSARTRDWIDEQSEICRAYLNELPRRDAISQRVNQLLAREAIGDIRKCGNSIIYTRCGIGEDQAKLYIRNGILGREELLLDPAMFCEGNSLSLSIREVSPNGALVALGVRTGGEGVVRVRILDLNTREIMDELPKGAVRGFAFLKESDGFIYSLDPIEAAGQILIEKERTAKLHYFGQSMDQDKTVFRTESAPNVRLVVGFDCATCTAVHTVIRAVAGDNLTTVYLQNLRTSDASITALIEDSPNSWEVRIHDSSVYIFQGSPGGVPRKLQRLPLFCPNLTLAETILIEGALPIQSWHIVGERIITLSVENLSSMMRMYSLDGRFLGMIDLPEPGTANLLGGDGRGVFFSFESYRQPIQIYHLDFATNEQRLFGDQSERFEQVEVRNLEYSSFDGTVVPLTLLGHPRTFEDSHAPTVLTAYGASGASLTPRNSIVAMVLVDLGAIFAIAHIRGGGELGRHWAEAGRRRNRPTVHKDFIAAAEFLAKSDISNSECIAIVGGSNSGLLVGTAMTKRPELFCAVMCVAPMTDMLRYHLYNNTQFYIPQFGTAADPDDFPVLLDISPYHNLHDGVCYPPLLMISGDADTRLDPMHARKFVARLQAVANGANDREERECPILLDWDSRRGHVASLPLPARAGALVDRLSFLCYHLRMVDNQ
jgi:prolyl oligopeptidase